MTLTTILICYWVIVTLGYLHFFFTYLRPTTRIILAMGMTDRYRQAFEASGFLDARVRFMAYVALYIAFLVFPVVIYWHLKSLPTLEERTRKAAFSYLEKLVANS